LQFDGYELRITGWIENLADFANQSTTSMLIDRDHWSINGLPDSLGHDRCVLIVRDCSSATTDQCRLISGSHGGLRCRII
jgi:hypothetical protein